MANTTLMTIARRVEALGVAGPLMAGAGLRIVGEAIMTDVKASRPGHGVPVRYGVLRSTGRVTGPRLDGLEPVVTLSFGGAAAPYALKQHEDVTLRHTVGEARYLVNGVTRFQAGGFAATRASWEAQLAAAVARARRVP